MLKFLESKEKPCGNTEIKSGNTIDWRAKSMEVKSNETPTIGEPLMPPGIPQPANRTVLTQSNSSASIWTTPSTHTWPTTPGEKSEAQLKHEKLWPTIPWNDTWEQFAKSSAQVESAEVKPKETMLSRLRF